MYNITSTIVERKLNFHLSESTWKYTCYVPESACSDQPLLNTEKLTLNKAQIVEDTKY